MVHIRNGLHLGWCLFGMVSIRDDVHLGWCVSIRDCVFRDREQDSHKTWLFAFDDKKKAIAKSVLTKAYSI